MERKGNKGVTYDFTSVTDLLSAWGSFYTRNVDTTALAKAITKSKIVPFIRKWSDYKDMKDPESAILAFQVLRDYFNLKASETLLPGNLLATWFICKGFKESAGFNPKSNIQKASLAQGVWQFIPSTRKNLAKVNNYIPLEERIRLNTILIKYGRDMDVNQVTLPEYSADIIVQIQYLVAMVEGIIPLIRKIFTYDSMGIHFSPNYKNLENALCSTMMYWTETYKIKAYYPLLIFCGSWAWGSSYVSSADRWIQRDTQVAKDPVNLDKNGSTATFEGMALATIPYAIAKTLKMEI